MKPKEPLRKHRFIQSVRAEPVEAFASMLSYIGSISTRPSVLSKVEGSMRTDLICVSLNKSSVERVAATTRVGRSFSSGLLHQACSGGDRPFVSSSFVQPVLQNHRYAHVGLVQRFPNLTTILLLLSVMLFAGCATVSRNDQGDQTSQAAQGVKPVDPYESTNRAFYKITDVVDRTVLEPVANAYIEHVPYPLRRSIGNFYDNVAYPNVALNAFLQGKVQQGLEDTLRFAVNSTIGLFGLFDMATPMGLKQNDEDFGQTLGVWGVDTGSYLFLPFLGPSSSRDVSSIPVGIVTNALFYITSAAVFAPIGILGIIDKRARLSGSMLIRDQAALDAYLFVREASLQQRKHQIYDGSPPPESYDDPFQDDSVESNPVQNNPARDRRTDRVSRLQSDPIEMTLDLPRADLPYIDLQHNPARDRRTDRAPLLRQEGGVITGPELLTP